MSNHDTNVVHGDNYINHTPGIKSWLTTLDHKRIGMMYLFTVMLCSSWAVSSPWEFVWNFSLQACSS